MKTLEKLQLRNFKREDIKRLVETLNIDDAKTLIDTGFSDTIRQRARGQFIKLNKGNKIKKVIDIISSKEMSLNKASRKCKVSAKDVRAYIKETGFNYDPTLIKNDRSGEDCRLIDRLHYHKWDKTLEIKSDFFLEIQEVG